MKKVIAVTRTITVTQRVPLSDYMTEDPREAIAYEKQMPFIEKVSAFMETLEYTDRSNVMLEERIQVIEEEDL